MSDKISVKVNNEPRELFMSFGLLTTLCNIIENPVRVASVAVNPELRSQFLSHILADRKPSGKIIKEIEDIDDVEISIADAEKLINWASEHVVNFFLRNIKTATDLIKKNESLIADLQSSTIGSPEQTSEKA